VASGDTLGKWSALSAELGTGTPGLLDVRNNHPVVALTTNDEVNFSDTLSRNYAGGGITVYLHYAMVSATTNKVAFTTSFEDVGTAQDTDSDGFATGVTSADSTVSGTSGVIVIVSVAHTNGAQIDSLAVGEGFRLKVKRVAPVGTDATGDAQLFWVELKET
jgi:hypothetical protein